MNRKKKAQKCNPPHVVTKLEPSPKQEGVFCFFVSLTLGSLRTRLNNRVKIESEINK